MKPLLLLLMLLCVINASTAQTQHVPADFSSIQAAIDAAQEGDTVLVSPGIYYENLQLRGKNIVLTSRYQIEQNPDLIHQTIVDGSQPTHPDTASCLIIWKNETLATVVQGFTFRGGTGTNWLDPANAGTFREGGGILIEFSSPVIRDNIIRNNTVPATPGLVSAGGGGIRAGEGAPLIERNTIIHNYGDGYGGGIVLNYTPGAVVRNNIIAFNSGGRDYSGGGFWATGAGPGTIVDLKNNVIAYNQSLAGGAPNPGKGGGVWVYSIKLRAWNNIVWGNTQVEGKQMNQGGATLDVRYSCVQDGYPGATNMTLDPIFADTSCFLLEPGSPCIDAGNPVPADRDSTLNSKFALYPSRGGVRNDIGAYGGPARSIATCFDPFAEKTSFTRVQNSPVTTTPGDSRSVNWIDIDNDNDLDLFISNGPSGGANNYLYRNNGTGVFTAITADPVVMDNAPSDGATWADADNDGDNDCFVVNWYGVNNLYYKNNGDGSFEQITSGNLVTDGGFSETASWGDYNNDSFLDLYVTNSAGSKKNFLYRGQADGTFVKITTGPMVNDAFSSRCVNWVDYDSDGDSDLFVTNESNQNENLYRNDGLGAFTKMLGIPPLTSGGSTMSASWGDYDNDGDEDVVIVNDQNTPRLFKNDNAGNFVEVTNVPLTSTSGRSFGCQWADIDNDTDLDLFITNSFGNAALKNYLYRNNGDGSFSRDTLDISGRDTGWSYGCAFGDFDRDGDLDLATGNCYNATQNDFLYENHAAERLNHWFGLHCVGVASNRSAIGAVVRIKITIDGAPLWLMRSISAQTGYCGQNQLDPHFGLGPANGIDSMLIRWPSGLVQSFGPILADQYITVTEGQLPSGVADPEIPGITVSKPFPNPAHDTASLAIDLQTRTDIRVSVLDCNGRVLYDFGRHYLEPGRQIFNWSGRSTAGQPVVAGQYWFVVESGGQKVACPLSWSGGGH